MHQFRLSSIDSLHVSICGSMTQLTFKYQVYRTLGCPPLVRICLFGTKCYILFLKGLAPRVLMIRHAVIQHTVHIKKHRFELHYLAFGWVNSLFLFPLQPSLRAVMPHTLAYGTIEPHKDKPFYASLPHNCIYSLFIAFV